MYRLMLFVCVLVLVVGCGKSKDSAKKDGGSGGTSNGSSSTPEKKFTSQPVQLAYEYLTEVWKTKVDIVGTPREQQTTFKKSPAVAVHVSWKLGGEQKDNLIIVQDGRVRADETYDTSKSFEENVSSTVKKLE